MRLTLVDRIVELEPGKQIKATKCLTLSEDYLQDHFPKFPVMPGVLMLEAMYQTAAWLVRATDDFSHSMVTMSEANNVKYSDFVEPGETLTVTADLMKQDDRFVKLKCQGEVGDQIAVRGRLVLERYNLADDKSENVAIDKYILRNLQRKFRLLYPAAISNPDN